MSEFFRGNPSDQEPKQVKRLTRADVERKIAAGEQFESADVSGLDLAGLPLAKKNFRSARAENVRLYRKGPDAKSFVATDISDSDWTDAVLVSESSGTIFIRVNAEGARFGYSESLAACRERNRVQFEKTGLMPNDERNALFGFNGSGGNFKKTSWKNVDFGGGDYGAYLDQADFSSANFDGCDLSGIDFSSCNLEGVSINDALELRGLKLSEHAADAVARGLSFSDPDKHNDLEERAYMYEGDPRAFLESYGIIIVT